MVEKISAEQAQTGSRRANGTPSSMEATTQNSPAGVSPDGAQRRSRRGEHRTNHPTGHSAQVMYTFDGVAPNELSVRAGETVEILEQRDRGRETRREPQACKLETDNRHAPRLVACQARRIRGLGAIKLRAAARRDGRGIQRG